jgi:hypothetical protein
LLHIVAGILESSGRISLHRGQHTTAHRLQVTDRLFHAWLVGIGITPRKTHTIASIAVPDDYFGDFLRGHLDGDGSITTYVDRYQTRLKPSYVYQRLYIRFPSASRIHTEWLQSRIAALRGVRGYLSAEARRGGRAPMYTLHFAKREAITLLRWIYYAPNLPCLSRKRAIAEPFLTGALRDFRHPKDLAAPSPAPVLHDGALAAHGEG